MAEGEDPAYSGDRGAFRLTTPVVDFGLDVKDGRVGVTPGASSAFLKRRVPP